MRYIFLVLTALLVTVNIEAQINVNINLDRQPVWGPTGYDYVEYYYLPDIDAYYNVPQSQFYCYNEGAWISSSSLPSRYSQYDLYKSYKVVVFEQKPWRNNKSHKEKYFTYKNRHDQVVIRDSRDSKYYVIKNHPEHNNWVKKQNDNKGNDKHRDSKNGKKKK